MEMSLEGPKMVGGRYGLAWNGRRMKKSSDPRLRLRRVRRPDPGASGGGWP